MYEMLHAFLAIYTCCREHCERSAADGKGLTGHGPEWVTLATTVESMLSNVLHCIFAIRRAAGCAPKSTLLWRGPMLLVFDCIVPTCQLEFHTWRPTSSPIKFCTHT